MSISIKKCDELSNENISWFFAYDNAYKIGTVQILAESGINWLNYIILEDDCHDKEYGIAIIKHLLVEFDSFRISLSSKTAHNHKSKINNDIRYLTRAGFNLVKKCFERNILNKKHFGFPFDEVLDLYLDDKFLERF
ncbi:MAG: hypothetical protein RB294_06045 [Bacteroidales bacterium]|jgi:hypothetical protein|nr:hypothetical protein [Bacteroidales bacterium]